MCSPRRPTLVSPQVDLQPCYDTPYETHVFDAIALTGARIKGEDTATGTVQLKALWMPLDQQIREGLDLELGEDVEGHADDIAFHQVTQAASRADCMLTAWLIAC